MPDDVVKPEPTATPGATVVTAPAGTPEAKPVDPAAAAPAGEVKPGEVKPGEVKKEDGAPEKYADFKLPEGFTLDKEKFSKFQDLAKGLGISQDGAQKLIDLASANSMAAEKAQADAWAKTRETWVAEIKADPEIGGQNLDASVQLAKRALKEFANDKVIHFLETTGYGDNPDLVRMFVNIGKRMSEDKLVDGKPSGTADGRTAAEVLYGKT